MAFRSVLRHPAHMVLLVPVLVAVVGVLVYALASNKAAELGRLAFFAGLLVALLGLAHQGVRVLPGG